MTKVNILEKLNVVRQQIKDLEGQRRCLYVFDDTEYNFDMNKLRIKRKVLMEIWYDWDKE